MDLIDQAMREMPIGMRVIKGTSETEDETVSLVQAELPPGRRDPWRDKP